MGVLTVGTPLEWTESVKHSQYIREHGLRQFLLTWNRVKHIKKDRLYYGDEVEHSILKVDKEGKTVRIALRGVELMEELRRREEESSDLQITGATWHQEYGSWMLESTPAKPYGGFTSSLVEVERNMRLRRARLLSVLAPDEIAPTLVSFPLMGCGDFVHPQAAPGGPASESRTVPDVCINPHPRFGTLTANIRSRRGSKVDIRVPLFEDSRTIAALQEAGEDTASPHIKMDCMAYGMGCCCLQVTFQASDIHESRYLYDQLATLAPIMLALTAATPIFQGKLGAIDARWSTICASVDDRTAAERGEAETPPLPNPAMAGGGVRRLAKSRYASISSYIQPDLANDASLNDVACEVDEDAQALLLKEGIDPALARHLAHLFVRDPLTVFEGMISEVDDSTSMAHFDNINSTNWQTVRWKPPPITQQGDPHIGWRTEFRSMEVQLTDFENAAFTAFVVLVTRALLVFDLDFLIPLSKVDDNMERAHATNAVNECKFWHRKWIIPSADCYPDDVRAAQSNSHSDEFEEMTMNEIINGKGHYFPGLVPVCYTYLEHIGCDEISLLRLSDYLELVSKRADGTLMTPAVWMRKFVRQHPEYKQDSDVSQSIAYDLVQACDEIGRGVRSCPEVIGFDVAIKPITPEGSYGTALKGSKDKTARCALLRKLQGGKKAVVVSQGNPLGDNAEVKCYACNGTYTLGVNAQGAITDIAKPASGYSNDTSAFISSLLV